MKRTRLNDEILFARKRRCAGFSLMELLIVVAIMGILAGLVLPLLNPNIHEQLEASAQVLAADISYARNLSVSNNSKYQITFEIVENRYITQHSGPNPALDTLPRSPFQKPTDPPNKYITDLGEVPHTGPKVKLFVVHSLAGGKVVEGDVEFSPLGGVTRTGKTVVWLSCGANKSLRYISVSIHPITGLTEIGDVQATTP